LHHYFPSVSFGSFYELLNQPIEALEPGSPLVHHPSHSQDIYLILSGIVTAPKSDVLVGLEYVAGYLVGDDPDCPLSQMISKSFTEILRIPRRIFDSFLDRYHLKESFSKNISRRRMLQNSELFQSIKWSPLLNKIAKSVFEIQIKNEQIVSHFTGHFVFILESGRLSLFRDGYSEVLLPGQFCYEDNVISDHPYKRRFQAIQKSPNFQDIAS
ncbi:MAG: hypothetical protein NTX25_03730, partial [Proteobacteria bacterium]|nr:hypothetical protein [Pseudomonadota bacterium]